MAFKTFAVFILAAVAEICGCYSLWAVLRLKASPLWLCPGLLSLCAFAWLLTLTDTSAAGRAFAGYGAIYIAASIGWLWLVEKQRPDIWDLAGLVLCLCGSALILLAPRHA